MTNAIILNKIEDAFMVSQDINILNDNDLLYFSTNPAIDIYLKENHNISCQCLSTFISSCSAIKNIEISDSISNDIVDLLDNLYSNDICCNINLQKIRFFKALYSYTAYFQLNVYLNLFTALKKIAEIYQIDKVAFFNNKFDSFMNCSTSLEDFIHKLFPEFNASIIKPKIVNKKGSLIGLADELQLMNRLIKKITVLGLRYSLQKVLIRLREYWQSKYNRYREGIPYILIFEPLYDLCFLKRRLVNHNIIYYDKIKINRLKMKGNDFSKIKKDFSRSLAKNDEEYAIFKNLLIDDIREDFIKNIVDNIEYLSALERLMNRVNIKLGIWGNSPVVGKKALANEYLMAKGINVIGSQHGGLLGNRFNDDVFKSDLKRCTHYVSYGFVKDDIKKIYPNEEIVPNIYPYGTTKKVIKGKKDTYDILLPMANTISMLSGGMIREKPDVLISNQRKIIEYLNSLVGYKIAIKPFLGSTYKDFGMLSLVKKCDNIEVINYMTYEQTLSHFQIKCVIIELMSTAFYESLGHDLELFVLHDSVRPIEASALRKLKKRAHYFEDVDDLIRGVDSFLKGQNEIKRDDSFYNYYVYKKNAEENILRLITDLIEGKDGKTHK